MDTGQTITLAALHSSQELRGSIGRILGFRLTLISYRVPTEAANQLPPAEFAAVLTQKLEKLKREQEINDRLSRKLSEECGSMVSQTSSRSLADILREKLILPDDGDGDQSILDDHVSRVWTDKTPLR